MYDLLSDYTDIAATDWMCREIFTRLLRVTHTYHCLDQQLDFLIFANKLCGDDFCGDYIIVRDMCKYSLLLILLLHLLLNIPSKIYEARMGNSGFIFLKYWTVPMIGVFLQVWVITCDGMMLGGMVCAAPLPM